MIRLLLAAALALLVASPASGQIDKGCYNYSGANVATAKSVDKLRADIACFVRVKAKADDSIADREKRIAQLTAPKPVPRRAGLVAEGDSITLKWGGNYVGQYEAAHPKVKLTALAVAGSRISDTGGGNGMLQRLPTLIAAEPAVVSILNGANDLGDGQYPTPKAWLAALWSYVG